MRPTSFLLVSLCIAAVGCADVACPNGLVSMDGVSCVCLAGTVPSGGSELMCVPGLSPAVTLDAGRMDASAPTAASRPVPEDAGSTDAGHAPDGSIPDASG